MYNFRYCRFPSSARQCVCPSMCQPWACPQITYVPFKPGSPNLYQRCKTPWSRSLLFWEWLTLTFKAKFNFKVKIYPILSLSALLTHQPFYLGSPNLDQGCKIPWSRSLLFCGVMTLTFKLKLPESQNFIIYAQFYHQSKYTCLWRIYITAMTTSWSWLLHGPDCFTILCTYWYT